MTSHITSAKMNEICIKRHSEGCENDDGDYLINFRQNNELSLTNKCFKHKKSYLANYLATNMYQ